MWSKALPVLLTLALPILATTSALAAPPWSPDEEALVYADGSNQMFELLDCEAQGHSGLVIEGIVTITHPRANSDKAEKIEITCPFILFREGAELQSKDELFIKVPIQISGPVRIVSTRGEAGKPALETPEIWEIRKKPKAGTGGDGRNGDRARTNLGGDWDAEDGGVGGTGGQGHDGDDGRVGNPGLGGLTASRIQLTVGDFADGSTLEMHADGGNGGPGGKGGRGEDGGDGGVGGQGGRGGDGNELHDGNTGGNGGRGGDGGDGGDGGAGGVGGPGGNGADVWLFMVNGSQSPAGIDMTANGGSGGVGGEGGDPGMEGVGGKGGPPGCGGSGGRFVGIRVNRDGSCATSGSDGANGVPGQKGPPGAFGVRGSNGNIMDIKLQYVDRSEL